MKCLIGILVFFNSYGFQVLHLTHQVVDFLTDSTLTLLGFLFRLAIGFDYYFFTSSNPIEFQCLSFNISVKMPCVLYAKLNLVVESLLGGSNSSTDRFELLFRAFHCLPIFLFPLICDELAFHLVLYLHALDTIEALDLGLLWVWLLELLYNSLVLDYWDDVFLLLDTLQ